MKNKVCAVAIIAGRVQGVCFRMETKKTADNLGIHGWVRNKRDGTVEATFEGDKEAVDAALEWCNHGPVMSRVTSVNVNYKEYSGNFRNFEIRI